MTIFFVSGYLIAGQLLAELGRDARLDLRGFYVRRALRLYPALLAVVAASVVLYPVLGGSMTPGDLAAALLYGANVWETAGGFDSGLPGASHPFAALWSLAVEEHYYLVFPLLALALGRHRLGFALATCALIAAVGAWRSQVAAHCGQAAMACHALRVEHGTDTRVDSILFGALLAILLDGPLRERTLLVARSRAAFAPAAIVSGSNAPGTALARSSSASVLSTDFAMRRILFCTRARFSHLLFADSLMRAAPVLRSRAVSGRGRGPVV